jgi:hypothetical protein
MLFFLLSQPVRFAIAGSGPWLLVAKWLTAP